MYEVNEAARVITASVDPNAKVIFGTVIDEALKGEVRITVIATGFGKGPLAAARPLPKKITPTGFDAYEPVKEPERRPQPRPIASQRPAAPITPPTHAAAPTPKPEMPKKPEDDLEIPAFIRRKMM
jgi:cell division protein FtsZ